MTDPKSEPTNRQMVEQLKQTIFGKLPITVILFAAACVKGDLAKRMVHANEYIDKVIKTGNDASKTLFGITSEIIRDEQINELYGGRPPSMDEIGEIMHKGLEQLIGAVEAGLFVRKDIIELTENFYGLAHAVMLPESDAPDDNDMVRFALAAVDKMREAVAGENDQGNSTTQNGLSQDLTRCLDSALDHAVELLKSGTDPIIPFAMVWDASDKRTIQRSISEDYDYAVEMAHSCVKSKAGELICYAIAWSGYVTMEGTKYDAVLVEAAERNSEKAVLMAMRYIPASETTEYKELGRVSLLEYRDNLLLPENKA